MIQIAYVDIRDLEPHYESLYRAADADRRRKAASCRREEALRCIAAGALLRYAAGCRGISEYTIQENRWGKPCLENHPGFHFNLTHSGHFAAIAWGDEEVGIDLETIRTRDTIHQLARRHFTVPEQKYLFAQDTESRFYEIWTAKESYLKYLGTGLTRPLASFCTRSPELQTMLTCFSPEDDICLTVCSEGPCTAPVRLAAEHVL